MKPSLLLIVFFGFHITYGQSPVGVFQNHMDLGTPKTAGSAQYDEATQTYTVKGGGYNIWFGRDEFQYAFNKLKGDFILTANFEFVGAGKEAHRKIGWMVRASTDDNAPHYSAVLHGDGLTMLQWRPLKGAFMRDPEDQVAASKRYYTIIQLERSGKMI